MVGKMCVNLVICRQITVKACCNMKDTSRILVVSKALMFSSDRYTYLSMAAIKSMNAAFHWLSSNTLSMDVRCVQKMATTERISLNT